MMLLAILFLIFCTVTLVGYAVVPAMYSQAVVLKDKRQQKISNTMETILPRDEAKRMSQLFVLAPFILAIAFYILFPANMQFLGVVVGFVGGLVFPGVYVQFLAGKRKDKFTDQLVDSLMIMSSSFRGGLSLIQALEAVVEEMPDPINKEFSIVLGENKMGVSLEDAMYHLYNRIPSNALQQMITAILLARETGGNLPDIFSRIVTNIRETKKIQKNLDTLTIQGKIQGVVLTMLPIGFSFIIYTSNRRVFDHMISSDLGRSLLILAAVLWVMGAFLIWKISTFKEY